MKRTAEIVVSRRLLAIERNAFRLRYVVDYCVRFDSLRLFHARIVVIRNVGNGYIVITDVFDFYCGGSALLIVTYGDYVIRNRGGRS